MPASFKMELLLAKAEPISDGGSASGITYLRRGKKGEHVRETALQTPRSGKKQGEEVLQVPEKRVFPCSPQ